MKKLLLLFVCTALITSVSWSQTKVFVGDTTGSSSYFYGPIYRSSSGSSFNYSAYSLLYEASDLLIPAGSTINKIAFKKANGFTLTGGVCDVTIRMKNSTSTGYTSPVTYGTMTSAPYTVVYASLTDSFTGGANTWHEWTLTTPFVYTGGSLEVSIDYQRDGAASNGALNWYYENASGKSAGIANSSAFTAIAQSSTSYSDKMLATRFDATYPLGACLPPSGLGVANITSTTADVSWTSGGAANAFVEYGPAGFTIGNGLTMYVNSTSAALTGLASNTTYDVYVKDSCLTNASQFIGPTTFTTLCANQTSGTVTIDPSLPASATNFQSFGAFANDVNACGIGGAITVNVKQGTYAEQVSFSSIIGSSNINTITIQSDPTNTMPVVLSYGASGSSDNWLLNLDGTSNITFDGITFESTGTTYSRIAVVGGTAENIAFTNNIFNGPVSSGTSTNNAHIYYGTGIEIDGLTFTGNEFNNGTTIVYITGSSSSPSDHFTFNNNIATGFSGYGLYCTYWKNVEVKGNDFTSIASTSTQYGVYFSTSTGTQGEQIIVEENFIRLNTTSTMYGIYTTYYEATALAPSRIVNNMISSESTTSTSTRYGIYPLGSNYLNIYHNTVSVLDGSATAGRAFYLNSSSSVTTGNINVKNNIFSNTGAGYAAEISSSATADISAMDYNLFNYDLNNASPLRYSNTNYANLAAWQAGAMLDGNSVEGDPLFVSTSDLHLVGATANDAGDNTVGITVDIDGDTRPASGSTTVDIGADEYTAANCTPPINAFATNVLATSATITWSHTVSNPDSTIVEYGLSGFTPGTGTIVNVLFPDTSVVLSSLTPQTDYEYYLTQGCSSSNSITVGSYAFSTACAAAVAPFLENFDGLALTSPYTDLPACWEPQVGPDYWDVTDDVTNNGHSYLPNIGDHTTGTSNYMWIDASSDILANEMVTPLIDMSSLTNPIAGFWFASDNTNNNVNHTISLDVWDGSAWQNVTTERGNFTGWVEVSGPIPSGVPSTTKFRIYAIADTGTTSATYYFNDLGVDDFFVMNAPSCVPPTMLGSFNATTTSVDVYWTPGGATDFNIEYGTPGFTPGSGTYMSSTNDTTTISGLTIGTAYDVYVRDSCGAGNASMWVGPITVSTQLCPTSDQCMFTVNMSDDYADGWNSGLISFEVNGIEIGEFGSGFTTGGTFADSTLICNMSTVYVILKNEGSYPEEMGVDVLSPQGVNVFSHPYTFGLSTGDTLGSFMAVCSVPMCPITDTAMATNQTSCGPNPVTFTATGAVLPTQEYIWLRPSDTSVVGMGSSFTTPPITATTNYLLTLGSRENTPMQHVGPLTSIAAAGFGNFSNGQFFRAFDSFFLDSMTVRADGNTVAFQVRISEQLATGAGTEIMRSDTIVVTGAGDHQVFVGLPIAPGSYFINIAFITAQTTGQLFRATSGAVYPYTIPNLVSIDSVNFAGARFYYTFDWVVSEVCTGPVSLVTANFGATPSTAFPYSADFNNGLPCNWSTSALSTGADWMNITDYSGSSLNSSAFMFVDDDAPGSSAMTEASLISPEFNAAGYDTLWIEFDQYFRSLTGSEGNVEVWDGTQWVSVYNVTATAGAWSTPDHQAIDITAYQNANLQVRFRYDDGGTYAWYWAIDNFEMDGTQTPCQNVVVDLTTDIYGTEISWSIVDTTTGTVYASGGPYADVTPYNAALATHVDTICLPIGQFFEFRIEDSYGDGLFDGTNTGTYSVDILCPVNPINVINGSGAFANGGTTNPPQYDSIVFEVTCVLPCADPDSLDAMPDCTTADLMWTSDAGAASSTIEYGATGFTPGSGTTISGATSPVTVTNLTMGASYDFYVQDSCSSGSTTAWVGPYTFTTDTMPNITISGTLVNSGNVVTYDFDVTSGSVSGTTYAWTFGDGGTGSGANTTHDYSANGTYTVVCVATNACGTDTATTTALVEGIGINEANMIQVELYPNPNNGSFTIKGLTNLGDKATLDVVNITGAVIYSQKINASSQESITINLEGAAAGMYSVRVTSDKGVASKSFVIKN